MKVMIYGHRIDTKDKIYADELMETLLYIGAEIAFSGTLEERLSLFEYSHKNHRVITTYKDLKAFRPDILITMGGDGTILRAVTMVRDTGVPILGINLGRMGFLAGIEKSRIRETLLDINNDNFFIEERDMISLKSNLPIFGKTPFALNDFTISKRDDSSMIIIKAYVDDELLNTYWADGIIVATPTGSTGYSLSCGGPILFPDAGSFVITPIAPHNLNVRPVVIPDNARITLEVEGRAENFMCTLDSRFETITSDHIITITKCNFPVRLVHLKGSNFMHTIRSKLMWGLDMRN